MDERARELDGRRTNLTPLKGEKENKSLKGL